MEPSVGVSNRVKSFPARHHVPGSSVWPPLTSVSLATIYHQVTVRSPFSQKNSVSLLCRTKSLLHSNAAIPTDTFDPENVRFYESNNLLGLLMYLSWDCRRHAHHVKSTILRNLFWQNNILRPTQSYFIGVEREIKGIQTQSGDKVKAICENFIWIPVTHAENMRLLSMLIIVGGHMSVWVESMRPGLIVSKGISGSPRMYHFNSLAWCWLITISHGPQS